jgi:hypothetical protein
LDEKLYEVTKMLLKYNAKVDQVSVADGSMFPVYFQKKADGATALSMNLSQTNVKVISGDCFLDYDFIVSKLI